MELSPTASRFDNAVSWLAAIGNEAALSVSDVFGVDAIHAGNRELSGALRASLCEVGWPPVDLPVASRSSIVSVPLGAADPTGLLAQATRRGIVCSAGTAICVCRSTSVTTRTTSSRSRAALSELPARDHLRADWAGGGAGMCLPVPKAALVR
jgi:selenocysteine lyase/cysteine desulfurase